MIAERLGDVKSRIAAAAERAGRRPESVKLVAVSKTVSAERCREAVAAGQFELGENYAQELRDKMPVVPSARWHFIGPLQRNKVKYVVGTAELIHSVESLSILEEIAKRASGKKIVQRYLIQVNVAREAQKSGCDEVELPRLLEAFGRFDSVRCEGLMCIPPLDEDPAPYFAKLQRLAERYHLIELSMGMSADYERAIEFGATIVRVGTAIFGARGD